MANRNPLEILDEAFREEWKSRERQMIDELRQAPLNYHSPTNPRNEVRQTDDGSIVVISDLDMPVVLKAEIVKAEE